MKFFIALLLLIVAFFTQAQTITNGRIAYYSFTGDIKDTDGSNHGAVFGATLTTDRFGNANSAYYYDGINDYIEIPHSAIEALTDLASPDFHTLAKTAKDVSAGAVLLATATALGVGLMVFGPKVVGLF